MTSAHLREAWRARLFHPAVVMAVALGAALVAATLTRIVFDGEREGFILYYSVPIGVPFVAFLFDRAERRAHRSWRLWLVDAPVIALSLTRAVVPIPHISGHVLFLAYTLLTARTAVARWTAAAIMIQVAYLKIVLWQDPTVFGGVLLGAVAALAFRRGAEAREAPLD